MKEYKNGFWTWKCDLDKLKRILLRDARGESSFTQWCIGEAIENRKRAQKPESRAERETREALEEDIF